jgi:acetyl-CoA carboxylase carboxyl transferase subunit alpha
MRITAEHLKQLGVIERVVIEPVGGAHRAPSAAVATLGDAIAQELDQLVQMSPDELRAQRRQKFLAIG